MDKFLLVDEDTGDYTEIQPNFSITDIIINNFLLFLFTIIARMLSNCNSCLYSSVSKNFLP